MKKASPLLLLPLLSLLASGNCHRHSHHDDPVIVVVEAEPEPEPEPTIVEAEPNDDEYSANDLGVLFPGDRVLISGEVSPCCDLFDGFAFVSSEPLFVEVFLDSHDNADLDICVYDPLIADFSLCFENEGTLEQGAFEIIFADAEFHVVVTPFDFASRYTLEIVASPLVEALPTTLAAAPPGVAGPTAGALRAPSGTDAPAARRAPAATLYRAAEEAPDDSDVVLGRGTLFTLDERTGQLTETPFVETERAIVVGPTHSEEP